MFRRLLTDRRVVPIILCLQVVPLLLLPRTSFTLASQEWWLPALLTLLVALAVFQLLVRRTPAVWPWRLMGFAQGLNVISRLMLLMPHASVQVNGVRQFNTTYVVLTALALVVSAALIGYLEMPEVRAGTQPRPARDPA